MRVTGQREKRGNCEICGGGGWVRWGSWKAHGNQKISTPPPPPFFGSDWDVTYIVLLVFVWVTPLS